MRRLMTFLNCPRSASVEGKDCRDPGYGDSCYSEPSRFRISITTTRVPVYLRSGNNKVSSSF